MTTSSPGPPNDSQPSDDGNTADELSELQTLLFGEDRAELLRLRRRLEELDFGAEGVSRVLPEAIVLRARRDKQMGKALQPTIEDAVRESVRRNPKPLADAIFPVIGPAVRKAVAQALNGMVHALNSAIEHSVSLKGLKWRWEAIRTGVPFAQVVMRHTLVYRVEQVFLIHRKTGLLLQHVVAPGAEAQDPDLVSGMLSAIQDFVSDSFGVEGGTGLQTFRVDGLVGRVEHGPHATLAAVMRGHPPAELFTVFQDALETIHLEFGQELVSFDGDAKPLAPATGVLDLCLRLQVQDADRRGLSPVLKAALALLVIGAGVWLFFSVRNGRRWDRAVERLRAEPGVVVVDADRRWGRYYVAGLTDPLARDPAAILAESNVPLDKVEGAWSDFLSFESPLVEQRAAALLTPPESVSLRFAAGTLFATGTASDAWAAKARDAVSRIPGVSVYDTSGLVNRDREVVRGLAADIAALRVDFPLGGARLTNGQDSILSVLVVRIGRLREAADRLGWPVSVEVVGRTDDAGSEATNRVLSLRRAEAVLAALGARGVDVEGLSAVGIGAAEPLPAANEEERTRINRSVSFRVVLGSRESAGGDMP